MLDPVERNAATHRRYTDEDLRWVILLTRLRATGMPIRRMREYADLVREGEGNERERLGLLESHRAAVLEQLDEVQRSLAAIDVKIDLYRELIACSRSSSSDRKGWRCPARASDAWACPSSTARPTRPSRSRRSTGRSSSASRCSTRPTSTGRSRTSGSSVARSPTGATRWCWRPSSASSATRTARAAGSTAAPATCGAP